MRWPSGWARLAAVGSARPRCARTRRRPEVELQLVRTDVHLVVGLDDVRTADPLPVHVRAVRGLEVDDRERAIHIEDTRVAARDPGLGDLQVVARRASDRDLALVEAVGARGLPRFGDGDAQHDPLAPQDHPPAKRFQANSRGGARGPIHPGGWAGDFISISAADFSGLSTRSTQLVGATGRC